MKTMS